MLILDVEASGTEYHKHSIIALGALDLRNPKNRFYEECRIWDGAHIMDGAREVHGLSDEQITDPSKQTEAELVEKFVTWAESLEDKTLGGQNVSFDRDFVKAAAERAGLNYSFAYRTVDSHSLAWMHMIHRGEEPPIDPEHKRSALNLDAVLNYCGIPEEPKPHNALTGAISHAEVIHRLLYGKKLLPEFEQYGVPWEDIAPFVSAE
jgi:DNA polymerase III epsilon subunit-like protein